jgi:hypothetical protein
MSLGLSSRLRGTKSLAGAQKSWLKYWEMGRVSRRSLVLGKSLRVFKRRGRRAEKRVRLMS